jgi:hypothetical protein
MATVRPRPVMVNTSSTGIKNGLSITGSGSGTYLLRPSPGCTAEDQRLGD